MTKKYEDTNQSVDRALVLLETLAMKTHSLNINEIAKLLSVTRITAKSLVNSLLNTNYIIKTNNNRYTIGYGMFQLASNYRYSFPFLATTEKYLISYTPKYGEKVNICVLKPYFACVTLLSKSNSLTTPHIHGPVFPAYASASGKLLISQLSEKELSEWIEEYGTFKQLTDKTITDIDALKKQLIDIKKQNYSTSFDELSYQESCIAKPLRDYSGRVIATISFSLSSASAKAHFDELLSELTLLSDFISSELGYTKNNY